MYHLLSCGLVFVSMCCISRKNEDYVGRDRYYSSLLGFLKSKPISAFPCSNSDNRLVDDYFSLFPEFRSMVGFSLDALPNLIVMALDPLRKPYRVRLRAKRVEWEKSLL